MRQGHWWPYFCQIQLHAPPKAAFRKEMEQIPSQRVHCDVSVFTTFGSCTQSYVSSTVLWPHHGREHHFRQPMWEGWQLYLPMQAAQTPFRQVDGVRQCWWTACCPHKLWGWLWDKGQLDILSLLLLLPCQYFLFGLHTSTGSYAAPGCTPLCWMGLSSRSCWLEVLKHSSKADKPIIDWPVPLWRHSI